MNSRMLTEKMRFILIAFNQIKSYVLRYEDKTCSIEQMVDLLNLTIFTYNSPFRSQIKDLLKISEEKLKEYIQIFEEVQAFILDNKKETYTYQTLDLLKTEMILRYIHKIKLTYVIDKDNNLKLLYG